MPKQILGMTRRSVLQGAAAATVAAALPDGAVAAPPAPAPIGDDVGFLSFGAVAESVLASFYTRAQALGDAWSGGERRLLDAAHDRHRANVDRLNAVLGHGAERQEAHVVADRSGGGRRGDRAVRQRRGHRRGGRALQHRAASHA